MLMSETPLWWRVREVHGLATTPTGLTPASLIFESGIAWKNPGWALSSPFSLERVYYFAGI
jgi:hypothetical protein